jgi:hypothetical protein
MGEVFRWVEGLRRFSLSQTTVRSSANAAKRAVGAAK